MKFGICNEIFQDWKDIGRTIDFVKRTGYDGLEIAPFTLAKYVTEISAQARREIRARAEQAGLEILGLHWLLAGTDGLYLNHPDAETRARTARYLEDLARFCADLGGRIMVFGSPKHRNLCEGVTRDEAFDLAARTFTAALPVCASCGVTICMEPLSTRETNFCNSAAEAVSLIDRIGHPNFRLLLDVKAMTDEPEGRPAVIRKYHQYLEHFHANDANFEGPGFGDVDFGPIFDALKIAGYTKYVSVEVFKFDPGPETIARKSLAYMRRFV